MAELIKHFERNQRGRDLIIGDIHGYFSKAMAALLAVGFDPMFDRVFSVGDLVDRGPESINALDWLDKPWFHAVKGNHEQMVIEEVDPYLHTCNGGGWFVGMTAAERRPYIDASKDLPVAMTIDTAEGRVGVVHADCVAPTWARLEHQPEEGFVQACMWSRSRTEAAIIGEVIPDIRAVVVGHTPMQHRPASAT